MRFNKIFTITFIVSTFFLLYLAIVNPPEAQAAEILCGIKSVDYNSTNHAPGADAVQVPDNTQFSLKVSCTGQNSTSANPMVNITVGGNTMSQNVSAFVSTVTFGPFPGLSASSVPAQSVLPYPVTFQSPDYDITCISVTFTSVCKVHVQNTAPGGTPQATLLPLPNCLALRGYNPTTPTVNQPFQIQFNLNNTNLSNGISRYKIDYTINNGPTQSSSLIDASAFAGVWVANMSAVPAVFNWKIMFDNNPCGTQGTLFSGSTGGGFGSGKNPCVGGICQTAFGPISTDLKDFATNILSIAIGIAGGIAFILMVIGAIRILTSQGDPKGVTGGREMMVAAVAGLLFLIFSVIILRFIGINLLGGVTGF